ncbi:hypothetical protein [Nostoc sp. UHCC 0252]|uniref:hypothetical protein n=1 Tax=Nostoc sp. UHCC 0252 TaxID=3110241 RepID=UPI002B1FD40A|nr:hypothetical protein [Nostoc sp. UHCC 0252]MEA5603161.1 hypothetical protein [Nostoc sp. UHCC 0252]
MKNVDKTQEYLNCIFFLDQDYSGFLLSKYPIKGNYALVQIAHSSFNGCCPHL